MKNDRRALVDRLRIPDAFVLIQKTNPKLGLFVKYTEKTSLYDISKSGMSFISNKPFKKDATLSIVLDIPGERKIKLKVRIRWIKNGFPDNKYLIGAQILPFGNSKQYNSMKALEQLRKLQNKV